MRKFKPPAKPGRNKLQVTVTRVAPSGRMNTWRCPGCGTQVQCLGTVVGHTCPAKKSTFVRRWELVS